MSQYPTWMKFACVEGITEHVQRAAETLHLRWRWRTLDNSSFEVEVRTPMEAYELGRVTTERIGNSAG